jgi:hypothetical protein
VCLKNKYLTEAKRDEVYKSCQTSCKTTHSTNPFGIMKQGKYARGHSLKLYFVISFTFSLPYFLFSSPGFLYQFPSSAWEIAWEMDRGKVDKISKVNRNSENEIWTTPSLRVEVVRNYRNSTIIQSLDSTKSRLITRRNTTLIRHQSLVNGMINRRCYSSSSSEVIKRLENSKRDLEAILVPKLRQNVLDYKRDNKTV